MSNSSRILPAGPGESKTSSSVPLRAVDAAPSRVTSLREHYAYRNAIPLLFKGAERFRGLSGSEILVLAALLRLARSDYDGQCWPTHGRLVDDLHGAISRRTVTRIVASLRQKGWIETRTVHSNQRLPDGHAVVGGERNVYRPNLARVVGQDGHGVPARSDTSPATAPKIAATRANARTRDLDPDLNKHIQQAPRSAGSSASDLISDQSERCRATGAEQREVVAREVIACWSHTSFPGPAGMASETLDFSKGRDGRRRIDRVLCMLDRGFTPQTLKDAILGATLDDYASGAGCPLGIVFGDKVLHYARRGATRRMALERTQRREDAERRRKQDARPRCCDRASNDKVSFQRMQEDVARLFGRRRAPDSCGRLSPSPTRRARD